MSLVNLAKREGRLILLVGLDNTDIAHLKLGDVVYLEARLENLPDVAIFTGGNHEDLEYIIKQMEKSNGG